MAKVTQRDRIVIVAGVICIVVMAAFLLLQKPMADYRKSDGWVQTAEENLQTAKQIEASLSGSRAAASSADLPQLSNRPLITIVTEVERNFGLANTGKVKYEIAATLIREAQVPLDTIRLTLLGVSLDEMVSIIHEIHKQAGILFVESADVRAMKDDTGLECVLLISQIRPGS